MTSNIFRVFGILVLLLLVFTVLNWSTSKKEPALSAVTQFLTAVAKQDRAALEQVIDLSNMQISFAGEKVTTITFKEVHVFEGAFSKRPQVKYSYLELTKMQIRPNERPNTMPGDDTAIASVVLTDGGMIYLRKIEGQWKIFYIDKPSIKE